MTEPLVQALDSISDGVQVLSPEWTYLYINTAAAAHGRKPVKELLGKNMLEMYPGIETTEVFQAMQSCLTEKLTKTHESEFVFADGTRAWFDLNMSPCDVGIVIFSREVTQRKQASDRFRLAVEAAPNAMLITNESGKILLCNLEAEALFGYTSEELLQLKVEELIPARFRANHPTYRSEFLKQPSHRAMGAGRDLFALRKNGEEVPVEIGLTPVETNSGWQVISSIVDISERRKWESDLRNKQRDLERTNEELAQFAHVASHDLQAPLRHVISYIELLRKNYWKFDDPKAEEWTSYVVDGSLRMKALINDLLLFSRAGKEEKALDRVNLNDVLSFVVRSLQKELDTVGGVCEIQKMPALLINESRIGQVFQNLIQNAIKFRAKDRELHIEIGCREEGKNHLFWVRDNGIGIEEIYWDRIFFVFERLHSKDDYPGNGIGLAICKKILQHYKGQIWVSSKSGEGTTFFFTLPKQEVG